MRRLYLLLLFLLAGQLVWGQGTTSYITLGDTPFRNSYSIAPTRGNLPSLTAEVTFAYNQTKETVTLQMIFRSQEYTHAWIPPDEDACLMQYAKDFRLFRTTRFFRQGLNRKDALKGITCSSSRKSDMKNCGLYAMDDTVFVQFRLKDENVDTFVVAINNIVPIIEKRSFFGWGKEKLHYKYFGGPLRWEIAIQRDPCIMSKNLAMRGRVSQLRTATKNVERHIKTVKGKECQACKEERLPRLKDSLLVIQRQLDIQHPCSELARDLDSIQRMITRIEKHPCDIVDPPICNNNIAANHIQYLTKAKTDLDSLHTEYLLKKRHNKKSDMERIMTEAEKIRLETNKYYKNKTTCKISPVCKKRPDVKKAIDDYERVAKRFD